MRYQACDSNGEVLSSFYVERDNKWETPIVGESLTRQEFAAECDINNIMAQYDKTGTISHVASQAPQYLDYAAMPQNLFEALAFLETAQKAFMTLPAAIRRDFNNDAKQFCDFAENPANLDKLREWGLAPPKPAAPQPSAPPSGEPSAA